MEFMQEFPGDDACLEFLWCTRYAKHSKQARCHKCKGAANFAGMSIRNSAKPGHARPAASIWRLPPGPSKRLLISGLESAIEVASPGLSPHEALEARETREALGKAIATLSHAQQQTVLLFYMGDC